MDLQTKLLSFEGRLNRKAYLLTYLILLAISFVLGLITGIIDAVLGTQIDAGNGQGIGVLSSIVSIIMIWPGLALTVKRIHDRGRSGWFLLIAFIPIVGAIWLFVETWFLRGTIGPNRFGPDPLQPDAQAIGQVFT